MIECRRKLMWEAYKKYQETSNSELRDVYKSNSSKKALAYDYCRKIAYNLFSYRYDEIKIIGANSQTFSVGFFGQYDGEVVFVYITKDYNRYIKLSDLMALEKKYGGSDE